MYWRMLEHILYVPDFVTRPLDEVVSLCFKWDCKRVKTEYLEVFSLKNDGSGEGDCGGGEWFEFMVSLAVEFFF
jgi:hypothetical protein